MDGFSKSLCDLCIVVQLGPQTWSTPAGVAVQVLSFLTTFSRTRKLFKCREQSDLLPKTFAECSVLQFPLVFLALPVLLTVCWFVGLVSFNVPLFLPVLQTSWLKMSVSCIWDVCYLAGSYGFWFGYSDTMIEINGGFFDTGSYLKFFLIFWGFLLIHIYLWFIGLCFL